MKIKVGFGFDVHQLVAGRRLMIGGVEIPFEKGTLGHSDGDVLLHAIMDALFGAAGMKDIGYHFPDTDPTLKDIDSKDLFKKTVAIIRNSGFSIGNIDATVALQKPKIGYAIDSMNHIIAELAGVEPEDISIKATTTEKLGYVGSGDGVAAYAVVLLEKTL